MKAFRGKPCRASLLDKHVYICDLINIEGPLLSLFRDHRSNLLYLWCDTNEIDTERWAVFQVSRELLAKYLQKEIPLLYMVWSSAQIFCLDITTSILDGKRSRSRRVVETNADSIQEYWPAPDSYFDESYSEDISLDEQIVPSRYHIPINGEWFVSDLDEFSRTYSSLYAFFYCTAPRFVTTIDSRVQKFLRSPWTGGFSRINLFRALEKMIPSIHDMKINRFKYASPGSIQIEALNSVGESIDGVVMVYLHFEKDILEAVKAINTALSSSNVKKANVSDLSNEQLEVSSEIISLLNWKTQVIGDLLQMHSSLQVLMQNSPNMIVGAKAVLAVTKQIERLAGYQKNGMLEVGRLIVEEEVQ